jgi:hypothetical protein
MGHCPLFTCAVEKGAIVLPLPAIAATLPLPVEKVIETDNTPKPRTYPAKVLDNSQKQGSYPADPMDNIRFSRTYLSDLTLNT